MTKKDFVKLADYIRTACKYTEPFTQVQIEYLADFCRDENPRFNRELWLDYVAGKCGPNGGRVK